LSRRTERENANQDTENRLHAVLRNGIPAHAGKFRLPAKQDRKDQERKDIVCRCVRASLDLIGRGLH
jgi:hypothetical protein